MSRTTFVKAVNGALHAAMAADERVIVIGEDVAEAWFGVEDAAAAEREALAAVEAAVEFARASPFPPLELVEELVYA